MQKLFPSIWKNYHENQMKEPTNLSNPLIHVTQGKIADINVGMMDSILEEKKKQNTERRNLQIFSTFSL